MMAEITTSARQDSTRNGRRTYAPLARGRPASRRIPSPPECLPRVLPGRSAVDGMDSQPQLTRDMLFDALWRGEMKPDEAEAEASRRGFAPLRPVVDPAAFDPTCEPNWTILMAVAWISRREVGDVRDVWSTYRAHFRSWHEVERIVASPDGVGIRKFRGWDLADIRGLSAGDLDDAAAYDLATGRPAPLLSVEASWLELWRALAEGRLHATAISIAAGRPMRISKDDWPYLQLARECSPTEKIHLKDRGSHFVFTSVLIPQTLIMHLWPALSAPSRLGAATTAGSVPIAEPRAEVEAANAGFASPSAASPPATKPSALDAFGASGKGESGENPGTPPIGTAGSETRCQQWLEEMMKASKKHKPKPKAEIEEEAKAKFSVSARAFERAWAAAVSGTGATWSNAGRPKKNPRA